jgi:hypothetical protein
VYANITEARLYENKNNKILGVYRVIDRPFYLDLEMYVVMPQRDLHVSWRVALDLH